MDNTKDNFEVRNREIEEYFSFLHIIDNENTLLKYTEDSEYVEKKVSPNLQRILIASSFLILYNLIESTVRNSIIEIYEKIKEDGISYNNLSENLKKIWLIQKTKNLKEDTANENTMQDNIQKIINNVVDNEIILLTKDNIDISGNIDAQEIRKLADKIGFEKSIDGRNLVTIKNKRNGLAHGDYTFYDVGKDYTIGELTNFKRETFDYLTDVINNIEEFINNKIYKLHEEQ